MYSSEKKRGILKSGIFHLSNGEIRVISFDAFPVAAGFGGLRLAAGKEPCSISGASAQLFGIISALGVEFPGGRCGFWVSG